jgi:flagellar hook-associated protein 1 FlgK
VGYVTGTFTKLPESSSAAARWAACWNSAAAPGPHPEFWAVAIALVHLQRAARAGPGLERRHGRRLLQAARPVIGADYRNNATSTTALSAKISDPTQLTPATMP